MSDTPAHDRIESIVNGADVVEDLHHLPGEAALRKLRRSLHEQHDVVRLHFVVDELLDAHICFLLGPSPQRLRLTGRLVPSNPVLSIYVAQTVVHPK